MKKHILSTLVIASAIIAVGPIPPARGQDRPASRVEALQALRRARVAMQVGEADEARKLVQAASDFGQQAGDRVVTAWSQQLSGELAFAAGQSEVAVAAFTAALAAFADLKDDPGTAGCHVNLGRLLAAAGKPREALEHQQAALKIYRQLNRLHELAAAHADMAAIHRALGETDKAEAAFENALQLYNDEAAGLPQAELQALAGLGACQLDQQKHEKAIESLQAALGLIESIKRAGQAPDVRTECSVHTTLGMAYHRQGNLDDALREYQAALKSPSTGQPDLAAEADVRNNLGALYHDRGQPQDALAEFNKALQRYTQLKDQHGTARTLYNLAVVHEAQGKNAEAIAAYEKALAIRRELKDARGAANILDSLALLYLAQNDTTKAQQCRDEAKQLRGQ